MSNTQFNVGDRVVDLCGLRGTVQSIDYQSGSILIQLDGMTSDRWYSFDYASKQFTHYLPTLSGSNSPPQQATQIQINDRVTDGTRTGTITDFFGTVLTVTWDDFTTTGYIHCDRYILPAGLSYLPTPITNTNISPNSPIALPKPQLQNYRPAGLSGAAPEIYLSPEMFNQMAKEFNSSECTHVWKHYQGFSESYHYCTKCDQKRGS